METDRKSVLLYLSITQTLNFVEYPQIKPQKCKQYDCISHKLKRKHVHKKHRNFKQHGLDPHNVERYILRQVEEKEQGRPVRTLVSDEIMATPLVVILSIEHSGAV